MLNVQVSLLEFDTKRHESTIFIHSVDSVGIVIFVPHQLRRYGVRTMVTMKPQASHS